MAVLPVKSEADIYTVVGLGRLMLDKVGFKYGDQVQLDTIIAGLTSLALQYSGECTVTLRCLECVQPGRDDDEFYSDAPETALRHHMPSCGGNGVISEAQFGLEVVVGDHRLETVDLAQLLAGGDDTAAAAGMKILSAQQLADEFVIDSQMGRGVRICARKWMSLPPSERAQ